MRRCTCVSLLAPSLAGLATSGVDAKKNILGLNSNLNILGLNRWQSEHWASPSKPPSTMPCVPPQGDITTWNHSSIAADNPGVSLPGAPIRVAFRNGTSGTTAVVSQYLANVGAG